MLQLRPVLNSQLAIEIFQRSFPPIGMDVCRFRPNASAVAREFGVSEKTVRDIWTARTWGNETLPWDPDRKPRVSRPTGRPLGSQDRAPRRKRTAQEYTGSPMHLDPGVTTSQDISLTDRHSVISGTVMPLSSMCQLQEHWLFACTEALPHFDSP